MVDRDIEASPATSYDTSSSRENEFHGHEETWFGYTREERDLANALALEQANNLSIHLYNAHAIKAMHYDRQKQHKSWKTKLLWFQQNADGSRQWTPSQFWTAWPMSAADVPRPQDRHGNLEAMRTANDETLKMKEPWYPGIDLEDEILALLLREAKTQFWGNLHDEGQLHESETSSESRPPDDSKHNLHEEPVEDPATTENESEGDAKGESAPAMQLIDDDTHARNLLLPSTRHILSSLDDLLLALHTSRAKPKAKAPVTPTSGISDVSPRKRKRASTAVNDSDQMGRLENDKDQDYHETLEYKPQVSYPRQSYTRDWSEVLGIATIAGLDHDVISRTAQRCSALFGEVINGVDSNAQINAADPADEGEEKLRTKKPRKGLTFQREDFLTSVLEELSQFGRHR